MYIVCLTPKNVSYHMFTEYQLPFNCSLPVTVLSIKGVYYLSQFTNTIVRNLGGVSSCFIFLGINSHHSFCFILVLYSFPIAPFFECNGSFFPPISALD